MKLLLHKGATRISRNDLKKIEPPKGTSTWAPVKHSDLLSVVTNSLEKHKIEILKEDLSVQRNGMFFFGTLDLKMKHKEKDFTSALGLRSSNNKLIAIQMAVGARVFVCDNLAFSGDLIALNRKHTVGLPLEKEVDRAIVAFAEKFEEFSEQIKNFKKTEIKMIDAKEIIFDLFIEKRIMPLRFMDDVAKEYANPSFEDFKPRTMWSLQNAFTKVAGELSEACRFRSLKILGKFFSELVF